MTTAQHPLQSSEPQGETMILPDLKKLQSLSLHDKIHLTNDYIKDWYDYFDGKVYVAFSGGIDSTVLLHLCRAIYPNIVAVFSDTGLEYPEIRDFVKTHDNVVVVKPQKNFKWVIENEGYPIISKRVSRYIKDCQNPTDKNANVRNLRLTGISSVTQPGKYQPSMKIPNKWKYLIDAPFKISDACCNHLKKAPLNKFSKESGLHRIIGIMAEESNARDQHAKRYGVNCYTAASQYSQPLVFWNRQDVLQYIVNNNLRYCEKIYGTIAIDTNGRYYTPNEQRTGCMFCMFGIHLEKGSNRFQRMKLSHPSQYNYCINNLGCGKVLEYIGVQP